MAVAEIFTKKKIVDIKESNDSFDREYRIRLEGVKTKQQLADFLRDYEEFLPEGLQRFRDAPDEAVREILFQKDRVVEHARHGQMLAEPTEAAVLFAPPMVSMPRMMAVALMTEARKKGKTIRITWGMAFKKLAMEGMIEKLMRTQERMYKKVIDIEKYMKGETDNIDLKWKPGEENIFPELERKK